jgi:hypothetical protein
MEMKRLIVRILKNVKPMASADSRMHSLPRVLDEKTLHQISGGAASAKGAFGPGGLPKKGW